MCSDPIVEEVRKARQEYAKRFNYDLHAMAEDLKKKEHQHQARPANPKQPRVLTCPGRAPSTNHRV